jgi:hypothetical protein
MDQEFEEIGHSGGKIIFDLRTNAEGRRSYQITFTSSRPVPLLLFAVYALPQGIPVGEIKLGGIGDTWNPPPVPGCYPVFIASDSQGKFGHHCPHCKGYWRSGPWPSVCPYCAAKERGFQFLSDAQIRYVEHYCNVLSNALDFEPDGETVIDMDIIADVVRDKGKKPDFYVSEQSQQRKFTCNACGEFNDILGRFGYCSLCGTRNDLQDFEEQTIENIRDRLKNGAPPEDCLRDAVASFDSFMTQITKQLIALAPLTERRRKKLSRQRFYDLNEIQKIFSAWFDIDIIAAMEEKELTFVARMFHRRHVYEHNGGEVDQKYINDSGDTTVRLKQHIHETPKDVHNFLSQLVKMARNVHHSFHELFPPIPDPIKAFKDYEARLAKYAKSRS